MSHGERVLTLHKGCKDFSFFVTNIFSESKDILKHGEWTGGDFIDDIAGWLQLNKKTARVSAKDHFKSTSFYAHIMWKILKLYMTKRSREIQYFSYKESMSAYHLGKIKQAVECNPWFNGILDLKKEADGIISYSWDGVHKLTVNPKGLLEFKRGIHCPDVYVDDPLQDPENKMIPTKITRINDIIKNQIMDMAQEELHIVGTAQTNHDFFFDKELMFRFSVRILPAIVDEANKIVLWEEWMDWDELMAKKRERGEKIFRQEYLVEPVYSANAYFPKEKLMKCVNASLKNYTIDEWDKEVERRIENDKTELLETDKVGGWDLGKRQHPAYFTWFEKIKGKRIQRMLKWFDGVDYTEQLEYISEVVERCGLYTVFYDSTRGELEMLEEKGELPAEFQGVHFTFKAKNAMATAWDKDITNGNIELINDKRSLDQILIVNNELQAPETPEGHGDSFWGVGLTYRDMETEGANITVVTT